MKKAQLVENCIETIQKFGLALDKSKCSKASVQKLIKILNDPNTKFNYLQHLYKLLKQIEEKEYKEFRYAWNLVDEKTWAFYEMMEYEKLREQIILEEARKKFKKIWRKEIQGDGKVQKETCGD